jgi:uncharacterized protein YqjF (DUF2071 family)
MAERLPASHSATAPAHWVGPTDSRRTRPHRLAVMRQKWRDLLFLHWAVSPEVLRRHIPPQLELDLFEGTAYIGLVPFTMTGVRPVGVPPVWGLSSFHETNLRTYVRSGSREPGVWFFNLEAANSIAVRLARAWFHLPYHRASMLLEHESPPRLQPAALPTIVYAGVRRWPGPLPASYTIRATPIGAPRSAQPGTLEHFLIERYFLYTLANNQVFQGQVYHTTYPIHSVKLHSLEENILASWEIKRPDAAPLTHYSQGVDVDVFALRSVSP